jgi:hypothetical protein
VEREGITVIPVAKARAAVALERVEARTGQVVAAAAVRS